MKRLSLPGRSKNVQFLILFHFTLQATNWLLGGQIILKCEEFGNIKVPDILLYIQSAFSFLGYSLIHVISMIIF